MRKSTTLAGFLVSLAVGLAAGSVLLLDGGPETQPALPLAVESSPAFVSEPSPEPVAFDPGDDPDRIGALLELAEAEPPLPDGRLAELAEDPSLSAEERALARDLLESDTTSAAARR